MKKRYKRREEIIFSQSISTYPYEEGAAKLYASFMKNNPQLEGEEIHCRVDKKEREEDYYGNGGGVEYTLIIFRWVKETEEQYQERQKAFINDTLNKFREGIFFPVRNLRSECYDIDDVEKIREGANRIFEAELEKSLEIYFNTI